MAAKPEPKPAKPVVPQRAQAMKFIIHGGNGMFE